jgi:hypothetical protein
MSATLSRKVTLKTSLVIGYVPYLTSLINVELMTTNDKFYNHNDQY